MASNAIMQCFSLLAITSSIIPAMAKVRRLSGTPTFSTSGAPGTSMQPTGFNLASRIYIPYGKGTGFAFGMGAAEQVAYDDGQKYLYAVSEQGYINIVDYNSHTSPQVLSALAVDLQGQKLTDV